MRSRNPGRRLLPMLLALALAAPLRAAIADDLDPPTVDGPKRVMRYLSCAGALASSITVPQVVGAILICIRVFLDELPRE